MYSKYLVAALKRESNEKRADEKQLEVFVSESIRLD